LEISPDETIQTTSLVNCKRKKKNENRSNGYLHPVLEAAQKMRQVKLITEIPAILY
jgi:hypothetical protein